MPELNLAQVRELLNKNWMTHDAMWFLHSLRECGMATANKLNLAAIDSMSRIEAGRYVRALGLDKVDTPEELRRFVEGVFNLAKADFMDFSYQLSDDGVLSMEMGECFAYHGIKRLGMLDQYQCGIYRRVEGWLDALDLSWEAEPRFEGCLKHQNGWCRRAYKIAF
ncbi:MAG: DUF6125 family protein [Desulfarculaceae bacterium]|nr:DUF6125 family protein [Desulfarculaceae bacterium]MCF8073545.1 DUF6125 family protein [Desulfarculaceae bacterium]MCF8103067.1 DUF6125 family protein [Desulfarculaceae bacterium]MCF8115739.1 DUF6125 family protein [Desulfarculaceae bacterium]